MSLSNESVANLTTISNVIPFPAPSKGGLTYNVEEFNFESVRSCYEQISHLALLQDNWDGYGARKPTMSALLGATNWAHLLFQEDTPVPYVFPVPNGNIQLEWSLSNLDLEIEVVSQSTCRAYFENRRTGELWEREFKVQLADLSNVIGLLGDKNRNFEAVRSQLM